MPDLCPKCGKPIEAGDVKCPACGVELPAAPDPAVQQKAAVLFAAMLPVLFLIIFFLFVGGIIFAGVKIHDVLQKSQAAANSSSAASPSVNNTPQATPSIPSPGVAQDQSQTPGKVPAEIPALPALPATASPVQVPVVTAPATPVSVAPEPAAPTAVVAPPVADAPLPPPPILSDFVPQIVPPGSPLVIRGQGLAAVDHVYLISTHGAVWVEADILQKIDIQVIINVPKIPFENDGIALLVTSPGGIAVMLDQHTGATPWGTDGHLRYTAVVVRPDDEITVGDNMLVVARDEAVISMGDHCTAFLERHVKIKAYGKGCHIYYVDPVELSDGVSKDGLTEVPSLQIDDDMDAFRVKPAPPEANQ